MTISQKILSFFHLTNIAELCAFFAGLLLLWRDRSRWVLFIALLAITIVTEITGWYLNAFMHIKQNALPFNLLMLLTISFSIWFFQFEILFTPGKKTINWLTITFLIAGLCNLLFGQGLWIYNYYSESLGDLIVAFFCCMFFFRHLRTETYRNFFTDPWFWYINGLLFASMGNAVLYFFSDELSKFYKQTHFDLYGTINNILNIIFYGSLIVAFLCRYRILKSSQHL